MRTEALPAFFARWNKWHHHWLSWQQNIGTTPCYQAVRWCFHKSSESRIQLSDPSDPGIHKRCIDGETSCSLRSIQTHSGSNWPCALITSWIIAHWLKRDVPCYHKKGIRQQFCQYITTKHVIKYPLRRRSLIIIHNLANSSMVNSYCLHGIRKHFPCPNTRYQWLVLLTMGIHHFIIVNMIIIIICSEWT